MPDVAIIGGGLVRLSAALFTEKNGLETVVFDTGANRSALDTRWDPRPGVLYRVEFHSSPEVGR